jgi:glycosyltransferase involved in cell wall biosynthesis
MKVGLEWFGGALGATGGVQTYTRSLRRALRTHAPGLELTLLGGEGTAPSDRRSSAAAAGAAALRLAIGHSPRDHVGRAIDALSLDVVHYPSTRMRELGLRTPVVLTFFDMQEEFFPRYFPARERLARRLSHRASVAEARLVIAPSRFTAQCLRERYGTRAEKIVFVPAGADEAFRPDMTPGDELVCRTHGLEPQGFLLYPAHPWPHKNHARLLAALTDLRSRAHALPPLVCTGALAGERSLPSAADAAVRWLGFVPEEHMPALYRAARAVVFPSLFEGFGLPVLEALASGCAVACADRTALPEVGGDAVRLFDPEDTRAIAAAIDAVAHDRALRDQLRGRGPERAADYRWPRLVPQLLDVYARAART